LICAASTAWVPLVKPHALAAGETVQQKHGLSAPDDTIGNIDVADADTR